MQENTTPMAGTGYLAVQVTTARGAIPLAGAFVSISRDDGGNELLYTLKTGADGRTERIALAAPARAESQSPSDVPPFSTYNLVVESRGYGTANYNHVPIFDGVTAYQQADLVPLPANGSPDGLTQNRPAQFGDGGDFGVQGGL
ncbi:MAG: hypothetical protein E7624_09205 [Ruminococcaceae bacterium]|nr:hypothetical protein [Oscillospiraceae bacterium]